MNYSGGIGAMKGAGVEMGTGHRWRVRRTTIKVID
jgi:hypothetical protein